MKQKVHSKISLLELYTGITLFQKYFQLKTNLVREEKGDLLADPHSFEHVEELFLSAISYTWG